MKGSLSKFLKFFFGRLRRPKCNPTITKNGLIARFIWLKNGLGSPVLAWVNPFSSMKTGY